MNRREDLISSLSRDLSPVKPPLHSNWQAVLWLLGSALLVIISTWLLGPIRSNALSQLMNEPQFFIETALGLVAIALLALVAFRAAIPGASSKTITSWAIAVTMLWLSFYVIGLAYPALEPSMLGKRDHCAIETVIYSLPPIAAALLLTRRGYALKPLPLVFSYSLAAAMLAALYMQIACMYSPQHILKLHILPGLITALLACSLVWLYKR